MTTTAERPNLTVDFLDAWMSSAKAMAWGQDQMQTLASGWMEQAKTMRQDGEKVLEVIVTQAKNNAAEMARHQDIAVKGLLNQVPGWDLLTVNDLRRQVAELNERLEALSAQR